MVKGTFGFKGRKEGREFGYEREGRRNEGLEGSLVRKRKDR